MKQHRKLNGFTIIEIMIVVVIFAILAALLIPVFTFARAQSLLSGCEANEKNISTALEMYGVDNGGIYPVPVNGMLPPPGTGTWGNYENINPVCPYNNSAYVYSASPANAPTGYTVSHTGTVHPNVPATYPIYNSASGLATH